MVDKQYFKSKIFKLENEAEFERLALELFHFQASENDVYRQYINLLGVTPQQINSLQQIPFLPISFFKSHQVITGSFAPQKVFSSSGTTGQQTSKHYVEDLVLYEESCRQGFERVYGPVKDYCVLALLPSYLERSGSSLIHMAEKMIEASEDPESSFYLHDLEKLNTVLQDKIRRGKKTLLLGVSFALLNLAETYSLPESDLIVMETGGMKGRRKEIIREELHALLCQGLGVKSIHSEYGMTELMSQAYSRGSGRFTTPPWMKIFVRETDDPFSSAKPGKTGGINVIDLANVDSCAFIETQDLGRIYADASFEVMGRFDNADIRGCNLMVI